MKQILLFTTCCVLITQSLGQCTTTFRPLDDAALEIFNTEPGINASVEAPRSDTGDIITQLFGTENETDHQNNVDPTAVTKCGPNEDCVHFYQCIDGKVNTNGSKIIDIRGSFTDENGVEQPKACHYAMLCCNVEHQIATPLVLPKNSDRKGCGNRNPNGVGFRISNNLENETNYGEFPWMVAMLEEITELEQSLSIYHCGGSIIHPQVVVTAAHCLHSKKPEDIVIRAGEWDTQNDFEQYRNQNRNVSRVITHPNYYKGALFNDIALLILDHPLELNEVVQPVCLPPPDSEENFDYARCFVTGWGKDQFGQSGKYQVILKRVDVPIVNRHECQDNLRKTRLSHFFNLHESFICAGGEEGRDACRGDGGGPLVCPIEGHRERYYQTGIVSWGIGCGQKDIPGVYANVAHLRRWIDEQMDSLNFEKSYYTVPQ